MNFVLVRVLAVVGFSLVANQCLAQFDDSPGLPGGESSPADSAIRGETANVRSADGNTVFVDQKNGTFKHGKSGLIWLSDPTGLQQPQSLEEAKAIVAQLKSGQHGLSDGSKAGDWRLPTAMEWDAAVDNKNRCLYSNFFIGWSERNENGQPEMYSRGYIGLASPGDRWDGQYDLTTWGDGGRDSLRFGRGGFIWPVRGAKGSGSTPGTTPGGTMNDQYSAENSRIVITLDRRMNDRLPDYVSYSKKLSLGDARLMMIATVSVNSLDNICRLEVITPGMKSLDNGGVGNEAEIFSGCEDWMIHRENQTVYARGAGFQEALQDLQTKLCGSSGRISVSGSGDPARGTAVIILQAQ